MLRRIAILLLAILISLGLVNSAVGAALSDPESSSNDNLVATTLNLKTNGANGVTATLTYTSLKPGGTLTGTTINLTNSGALNGSTLDIAFSYVESDGAQNGTTNLTADNVASILQVTTLTYDTADFLTGVGAPSGALTDTNSNGYIDLQDLKTSPNIARLTGCGGLLGSSGNIKAFNITLQLRSFVSGAGFVAGGTSNDNQGDGVNVTITFTLNQ